MALKMLGPRSNQPNSVLLFKRHTLKISRQLWCTWIGRIAFDGSQFFLKFSTWKENDTFIFPSELKQGLGSTSLDEMITNNTLCLGECRFMIELHSKKRYHSTSLDKMIPSAGISSITNERNLNLTSVYMEWQRRPKKVWARNLLNYAIHDKRTQLY